MMEKDDIKAMFQVNAALKSMALVDPRRLLVEDKAAKLTRQYEADYLYGKDVVGAHVPKISLQEAYDIIVKTCQSATDLELKHHPNGATDEQIESMAIARRLALDEVAAIMAEKLQNLS